VQKRSDDYGLRVLFCLQSNVYAVSRRDETIGREPLTSRFRSNSRAGSRLKFRGVLLGRKMRDDDRGMMQSKLTTDEIESHREFQEDTRPNHSTSHSPWNAFMPLNDIAAAIYAILQPLVTDPQATITYGRLVDGVTEFPPML
jgi:hypothetical protein